MDTEKCTEQIAHKIRVARENAGLSQAQAAKILGIHRPSLTEAEQGRRKISAAELAHMARLYRVRIGWLACEDEGEDDHGQDQIQLVAREISSLKSDDLEAVMHLVRSIRSAKESP